MFFDHNPTPYYIMIGDEDFLGVLGHLIIVIGSYNLSMELFRQSQEDEIELTIKPLGLIIMLAIFTIILELNINAVFGISYATMIVVMSSLVIYNIVLIRSVIRAYKPIDDDLILRLRQTLIYLMILFAHVWIIAMSIIFSPTGNYYPTRHSEVEYYIMSKSFMPLLVYAILLLLVYLPDQFLSLLRIDFRKKIEFGDYRFDNYQTMERRIRFLEDNPPSYTDFINPTTYILAYQENEKIIADQLERSYNGTVIKFNLFDDKVLQQVRLPNSDIIYFDAYNSNNSAEILKNIRSNYSINVRYEDYKIFYKKNIQFKSEKYHYALLTITPSYWNIYRKFWMILLHPNETSQIIDFLKKYKNYLEGISTTRQVYTIVLRFPIINGVVQNIPPIAEGLDIPDSDFIEIL